MSNTTLYNHKTLGSDIKPLIPNAAFKEACQKLRAGDTSIFEKVKDKYTLESSQERILAQMKSELC